MEVEKTVEIDIDVKLDVSDVVEFIENYATEKDFYMINVALNPDKEHEEYSGKDDVSGSMLKSFWKYIEADVDIEEEDVLDYLDYANSYTIDKIIKHLGVVKNFNPFGTSLYDDMKFDVLKEAFDKYNLDELEEKLK